MLYQICISSIISVESVWHGDAHTLIWLWLWNVEWNEGGRNFENDLSNLFLIWIILMESSAFGGLILNFNKTEYHRASVDCGILSAVLGALWHPESGLLCHGPDSIGGWLLLTGYWFWFGAWAIFKYRETISGIRARCKAFSASFATSNAIDLKSGIIEKRPFNLYGLIKLICTSSLNGFWKWLVGFCWLHLILFD